MGIIFGGKQPALILFKHCSLFDTILNCVESQWGPIDLLFAVVVRNYGEKDENRNSTRNGTEEGISTDGLFFGIGEHHHRIGRNNTETVNLTNPVRTALTSPERPG